MCSVKSTEESAAIYTSQLTNIRANMDFKGLWFEHKLEAKSNVNGEGNVLIFCLSV